MCIRDRNKSKHRIIMKGTIKFIDLFAGIGGIRCGLELEMCIRDRYSSIKITSKRTSRYQKFCSKLLEFTKRRDY